MKKKSFGIFVLLCISCIVILFLTTLQSESRGPVLQQGSQQGASSSTQKGDLLMIGNVQKEGGMPSSNLTR